jgi:hypothetical protein
MTQIYQRFVANIGGKVRYDMLEGKQYLVAPAVMMVEGVWKGSKGPLYYPASELSKTPGVWNMKPIVVYHPEMNGQAISACVPEVIQSRQVGMMLNSTWDGKLRTESWLDEEKLKKVDARVLESLKKGEMVEISTGLFTDNEETTGNFNGKDYVAIARNYRPDHLAILPDKVGACSIADGAGLLNNESPDEGDLEKDLDVLYNRYFSQKERKSMPREDMGDPERNAYPIKTQQDLNNAARLIGHAKDPAAVKARLRRIAKRKGLTLPKSWEDGPEKNESTMTKEEFIEKQSDYLKNCDVTKHSACVHYANGTEAIVANVISHQDVSKGITQAMLDEAGKGEGYWPGYIEDVYDNFYIYSSDGKYFKRGYSLDANYNVNPLPKETEVEVKPHKEYRTLNGEHVAVADREMKKPSGSADKRSGGDQIEQPTKPIFGHGKHMLQGNQAVTTPTTNNTPPVVTPAPVTLEQFIANSPPELRELFQAGVQAGVAEKDRLVEVIVANKANRFTKEYLKTLPMVNLQAIAALAATPEVPLTPPAPSYLGAFTPPAAPTTNAPSTQEALGMPHMVFNENPLDHQNRRRGDTTKDGGKK